MPDTDELCRYCGAKSEDDSGECYACYTALNIENALGDGTVEVGCPPEELAAAIGLDWPDDQDRLRSGMAKLVELVKRRGERKAGYLAQADQLIAEHGWMVQGVFPTVDDPEPHISWCYTIGLTAKGLPEVIVFGLPSQVGTYVCNEAAKRMVDPATTFGPGDTLDGMLADGYQVAVITNDFPIQHMGQAIGRYGDDVTALQLVVQDKGHRWPWQDGYELAGLPLLGEVPVGLRGES